MTIMTGVDVEPHMRRVLLLTAGDLDDFTYKPGQALVLVVPGQGGETGPARLYDPQVRSGCPNAQHRCFPPRRHACSDLGPDGKAPRSDLGARSPVPLRFNMP